MPLNTAQLPTPSDATAPADREHWIDKRDRERKQAEQPRKQPNDARARGALNAGFAETLDKDGHVPPAVLETCATGASTEFSINRTEVEHIAGGAEAHQAVTPDAPTIEVDGEKKDARTYLAKNLTPAVASLIQRGRRDARYDLKLTDGGTIAIGSMSDLQNAKRVQGAIGEATGQMPKFTPNGRLWHHILSALLAVRQVVDDDSTPESLTCSWLLDYTTRTASGAHVDISSSSALYDAIAQHPRPIFHGTDHRLYLSLRPFHQWLRGYEREFLPESDLRARLGRLGFESKQLAARHGDHVATQRYWRSPPNFNPGNAS